MKRIKSFLAVWMCFLMCPAAFCAPQGSGQSAGQINALIPAALRNGQTAKVQEAVAWNDLLKTDAHGRVRVGLNDGSILSVGSDSELRVVQHDAASQQTSLEVNFGKVRSQVEKITKPGGKFEIKTPNAVIGVIGTDLYTAFDGNKTTVICYKGVCKVNSFILHAGQMIEISAGGPAPFPHHASKLIRQQSQDDTDANENVEFAKNGGHFLRNFLIFTAVAGGIGAAGAVISTHSSGGCPPGEMPSPKAGPGVGGCVPI